MKKIITILEAAGARQLRFYELHSTCQMSNGITRLYDARYFELILLEIKFKKLHCRDRKSIAAYILHEGTTS